MTDVGRAQAQDAANILASFASGCKAIISSPLQRAQSTAAIISECLGVPVETDPDWVEMDNGPLAGLPFTEAAVRYPRPSFRNPYDKIAGSGESEWSLYARAARALERLIQRGPGHYVVVAHGGILNAALRTVLGSVPAGNNQGAVFDFGDLGYIRLTYFPAEHRWVVSEFHSGFFQALA